MNDNARRYTRQIEHSIGNFDTWKAAFDGDPAARERSGVRCYRVFRPVDDPKYVIIDLEFDGAPEAHAFLESMRKVWSRVDLSTGLLGQAGAPKVSPQARIVEEIENKQY